jgi:putative tricarboxylic transport membrane protein
MLFLNLPLIGLWVRILKVPYAILFPLILLFCVVGVYSINTTTHEVILMVLFGVIGYLMKNMAAQRLLTSIGHSQSFIMH